MYEGRTLDFEKTLEDNNVMLPGVAARKRGEKTELIFGLVGELNPAPKALIKHLQREDWMKDEAERNRLDQDRKRKEQDQLDEERKAEEKRKLGRVDVEFDEYISERIGTSDVLHRELLANNEERAQWIEKKRVDPSNHYLIPESDDVCTAMAKLMGSFTVLKVFRNQNDTLIRRYTRAKELLQGGGGAIQRHTADLAKKMHRRCAVRLLRSI